MDIFEAIHAILNPSDEGLKQLVRSEHDIFLPYFDLTKCNTMVAAECALEANSKPFYKSFCKAVSEGKSRKIRIPFSAVLEMDRRRATEPFDRKAAFFRWIELVKAKKFNGTLAVYIWTHLPESFRCTGEETCDLAKVFVNIYHYARYDQFRRLIICDDLLNSQADFIACLFNTERTLTNEAIVNDMAIAKASIRRAFSSRYVDDQLTAEEYAEFVHNPELVVYYKEMYEVHAVMAG